MSVPLISERTERHLQPFISLIHPVEMSEKLIHLQMRSTSAGDSAAYLRRTADLDDVVVVSALRTPQTKVQFPVVQDRCSLPESRPDLCLMSRSTGKHLHDNSSLSFRTD